MHYNRSPKNQASGSSWEMCVLRLYLFSLGLFHEAVLDHSREILEKSPLFILVPPRTLNKIFIKNIFILVPSRTLNRIYAYMYQRPCTPNRIYRTLKDIFPPVLKQQVSVQARPGTHCLTIQYFLLLH